MFREPVLKSAACLIGFAAVLSTIVIAQNQEPHTIPDLSGKILTVIGPIEPSQLGETLMHEHLFIDFQRTAPGTPYRPATDTDIYLKPLTLDILGEVRMGTRNRNNPFLGDFQETLAEVLEFKNRGGGAIVDVSNIGLGRDPRALMRLAHASDLNIIMGSGWYIKDFHPLDMDRRTVEELADIIVQDVTVGVDGTNIRSGIIGDVGVDCRAMTANEFKSARASARAARITGAPVTFHCGGFREEKFEVLDMIESEGVDLSRVIMGHSNSLAHDLPFMERLMARGVFLEFDYLGAPGSPGGWLVPRNDAKVAKGIAALVQAGYADRILLSHDVCTKIQLKRYGGTGFTYISDYFLPELRRLGVSDQDIHKIMVENPRRSLVFVAPQSPVT
jgi:phosphotriesterase-related protein